MLARTAAVLALLAVTAAPGSSSSERVRPNDNRTPAGRMRDGELLLRLEARLATWHPDGEAAPGVEVPAFAESGGAAQVPGPLVRVRAGTMVEIEIRNTLADSLRVHGLHARPANGAVPPIVLAPGERQVVRMRLDAPGTYHYWGTTTRRAINFRTLTDAQLTGAIVVDPERGQVPADRIFVIGMWTDTVHRALTHRARVLAVINGRSWPHTEGLAHGVGDTVRWRIVNGSADLHPMHLHGFYFRVDAKGDGFRDTVFGSAAQRMAVTENLISGATAQIRWVPERPGNWLFHCHVPEHFGPRGSLGVARAPDAAHGVALAGQAPLDHARGGMNGLVLGITVRPTRATAAPRPPSGPARALRLLVRTNVGSSTDTPFYGYAIHERGAEPAADSGLGAGPPLELTRGEPVRITVVNRLPEPTAVHWHGIELESYFDGVPGFSGSGRSVTPMIAPGDSFTVRFTPPRAGTFIYHTHAHEERQQLAGLAGALLVVDRGTRRDATRDIPVLLTAPTQHEDFGRAALINGRTTPPPLELRVGTTYRFRLIQMSAPRSALRVTFARDSMPLTWRPIAKDGADLPAAARTERTATITIGIGETWDYELTPTQPGTIRLEVRGGAAQGPLSGVMLARWMMVVR